MNPFVPNKAMVDTVTINKIYFETLLRKANVHGSESPLFHDDQPTVFVPKQEYDSLHAAYREYSALKTALLYGGVTQQNLQILINSGLEAEAEAPLEHNSNLLERGTACESSGNNKYLPASIKKSSAIQIKAPAPAPAPASPVFQENGYYGTSGANTRHLRTNGHHHRAPSDITTTQDAFDGKENVGLRSASSGNRTLFFSKLSPKTSYASLLEAIRGGAVVDVWMKPSDHCASVSFVEPAAAESFYRYAKKHDIYIDGRRIGVEWREPARQFVIVPNIMRQIHCNGASRNLSLRNIPPSLDEERLRDDLDHIANLHIEKVIFYRRSKSVQVNLNSIAVACFAKTCLRSRAFYKGCKVDFGDDDCAQKLPDFKASRASQPSKPVVEKPAGNRFDALLLDEDPEEDEETMGCETNETTSWADSGWNDSSANGVALDHDDEW